MGIAKIVPHSTATGVPYFGSGEPLGLVRFT